jgi:hypothetical protein
MTGYDPENNPLLSVHTRGALGQLNEYPLCSHGNFSFGGVFKVSVLSFVMGQSKWLIVTKPKNKKNLGKHPILLIEGTIGTNIKISCARST